MQFSLVSLEVTLLIQNKISEVFIGAYVSGIQGLFRDLSQRAILYQLSNTLEYLQSVKKSLVCLIAPSRHWCVLFKTSSI